MQAVIARLYALIPLPEKPVSNKTPKQEERNAEIYARYTEGWSVPKLARVYGITKTRVYQILKSSK